jgi:hypothetical protein
MKKILKLLFLVAIICNQAAVLRAQCPELQDVATTGNDAQNAAGLNSWVGHVYNIPTTPIPPTDAFNSANYKGYILENAANFNEIFGVINTDNFCFTVNNASAPGGTTTVLNNKFAVRFLMKNTALTGCYTINAGADDGIVIFVNGVRVINQWKEQGFTSYTATVNLTGNDDLIFEYYEKQWK